MSHHFDTPTGREDPRLNLADLYLFAGPPGFTVLAMTVNPEVSPDQSIAFRPDEGLYAFRFDLDGDAREDLAFKITFSEAFHDVGGQHRQHYAVRRATGPAAQTGIDGLAIAQGITNEILDVDGVRCFAGVAPDVFAGDGRALGAFLEAFEAGGHAPEVFENRENSFAQRHVAAIVLEVPNELIGEGIVHAWATISLVGHAPEIQVARWGLPLITHLFLRHSEDMKEAFNRSSPLEAEEFRPRIAHVIRETTLRAGTAADPDAYAARVLQRLGPIMLPYRIGTVASFDYVGFNGRGLADDVMDVMLSLTTNAPLGDGVAPDPRRFTQTFPYFRPSALEIGARR